jgi:hypothetical protein
LKSRPSERERIDTVAVGFDDQVPEIPEGRNYSAKNIPVNTHGSAMPIPIDPAQFHAT